MAEDKKIKLITGFCPYCFAPIDYAPTDTVVRCNFCDNKIEVSKLKKTSDGGILGAASDITPASTIDTSESGLAYLDNFIDNFDWDEFIQSSDIIIPSITKMVEKNKIKNASNSVTWDLELKSIIIPLKHKIEGLKTLKEMMIENYTGIDDTELYSIFDLYKKIVDSLLSSKPYFYKLIENDIKYYEKYGGKKESLARMNKDFDELKSLYETVSAVDSFQEIPEISSFIEKKDEETEALYQEKGINAKEIYHQALLIYSFEDDRKKALDLFLQIKDYKDSSKYIERINEFFAFNGELYEAAGKQFTIFNDKYDASILEGNKSGASFNMSSMETVSNVKTFSLYEIIDGLPNSKPLVKNVTKILCTYGNNIFYIEKDKNICAFNVVNSKVTILDTGKPGCYVLDNNRLYLNNEGTSFFIKKKIELKPQESEGCFKSLFKKKDKMKEEIESDAMLNNFEVVLFDLISLKTETIIDQVVDIMDYYNDTIFYTVAHKIRTQINTTFLVYNLNKRESKKILDTGCNIYGVHDGKVVYSLWSPNTYNEDLYVMDIETQKNVLIEDNIYDFFTMEEGRLFYTVGNEEHAPLFSNNFEGTDRLEIMPNIEEIFSIYAGWMYLIKRTGYNNMLIKMKLDGSKRVIICHDFKKIVKLINGYIYYLDEYDDLHIVRSDGQDDKVIAEDLLDEKNSIIIDQNHIYYLRHEQVSSKHSSNSLYRMDLDGHNVKKLAFNIIEMREFDYFTIYFSRQVVAQYEVGIPVNKDEYHYENKRFKLKKYVSYNRVTGDMFDILTLGLPNKESYEFKQGCFGKKVKKQSIYREIPIKHEYKRRNKAEVGDVNRQNTLATQQQESKNLPAQGNKGCGGCGSGCGSLFGQKK